MTGFLLNSDLGPHPVGSFAPEHQGSVFLGVSYDKTIPDPMLGVQKPLECFLSQAGSPLC